MPIPRLHQPQATANTKSEFRTSCFMTGLLLGPLGLLFINTSESKKGCISSAIIGWIVGWFLLLVAGLIFSQIKMNEEESEKRHREEMRLAAMREEDKRRRKEELEAERAREEMGRAREEENRAKEEAEQKQAALIKKRREQALKIIGHEVAADKEIVRNYQNEVLAIEENKSDFLRRLNAIAIPDTETVTNIVTVYIGKAQKKTVIKKVKLTEHQKSVRKLMRLYEDTAICSMYENCTERSAKKLLDELSKEWNTAEEDYNNVTKALQKIDAEETRERKMLSEQFQNERTSRIGNNGRRIAVLKNQRANIIKKINYHESGKCSIRHFAGQPCRCDISEWHNSLQSLNDEINSLQSELSAEKSTAIGLDQSSQLDAISNEASRKRAEINQEFTHQSAVLNVIADKYQRLLVEDLLDSMANRREYLLGQIDEIVARNNLKLKYIDGRSELSPEMATSFIEADEAKTIRGLNLDSSKTEEERANREHERMINTIKALDSETLNADESSERRLRKRRRR